MSMDNPREPSVDPDAGSSCVDPDVGSSCVDPDVGSFSDIAGESHGHDQTRNFPEMPSIPDSARRLPRHDPEEFVGTSSSSSAAPQERVESRGSDHPSQPETEVAAPVPDNMVRLNIYDLHKSVIAINDWLDQTFNSGAFHVGVEVYGIEYMYSGATGETSSERLRRLLGWKSEDEEYDALALTGIIRHLPRKHAVHVFKYTVPMGPTMYSMRQVNELVHQLGRSYTRAEYNIIRNNCVHFSSRLCSVLGVGGAPERLFGAAQSISSGIDSVKDTLDAAKNSLPLPSFETLGKTLWSDQTSKSNVMLYCGTVEPPEDTDCHEIWSAPGSTARGSRRSDANIRERLERQKASAAFFADCSSPTLESNDIPVTDGAAVQIVGDDKSLDERPWSSVPTEGNVAGTIQTLGSLGASRRSCRPRKPENYAKPGSDCTSPWTVSKSVPEDALSTECSPSESVKTDEESLRVEAPL